MISIEPRLCFQKTRFEKKNTHICSVFSSAGHVLKDMWAEGKLGAVYKGVGAPIAALCVLFAINFGFVWFFFVFFENSEFDFLFF